MRDLVLRYETQQDQVSLTVEEQQLGQTAHRSIYRNLCSFAEVENLSTQMYRLLGETVWVGASKPADPQELVNRLQQLRDQGIQLRRLLVPKAVGERIKNSTDIHHLIFQSSVEFFLVPVECLVLEEEFVGYQYPVGREVVPASGGELAFSSVDSAPAVPYRAFSVVDPDQLLEQAGVTQLRGCWERFRLQWSSGQLQVGGATIPYGQMIDLTDGRAFRPVEKSRLQEAFRQKEIILFIGHYLSQSASEGKSGFILGRQGANSSGYKMFTIQDLQEAFQASGGRPLLVVAIACESACPIGGNAGGTELLSSLVARVLQAGIPHYVGASVRIPADSSAALLEPFFGALVQGHSLGEALRVARMAFRGSPANPLDPGTALGLSFVGYGDPRRGYFCSYGHRCFRLPQQRCNGRTDTDRVCGRIICSREAMGFARFRCRVHEGAKQKCSAGHEVEDAAQLSTCKHCANSICPRCPGYSQRLCWEHRCHEGHEISGSERKTCLDPFARHPGEKRSVCSKDPGWLRGLCRDCFQERPPSCPHCGRFITQHNPWEVRCAICQQLHCRECVDWYRITGACQKDSSQAAEEKWLEVLRERANADPQLASLERLQEAGNLASQWRDLMATNLAQGVGPGLRLPRLSQPFWSFFLPDPPCLGGIRLVADLGAQLSRQLAEPWISDFARLQRPWQPPTRWQKAYGLVGPSPATRPTEAGGGEPASSANQLRVYRVAGFWGQSVWVAVATISPVEFQPGRGPVLVPAQKNHLDCVERVLQGWGRKDRLPDRYLVVLSTTGWAGGNGLTGCAQFYTSLTPGRLTIVAQPEGHSFHIAFPPVAGLPQRIEQFLTLFSPQPRSQLLEQICQQIEQTLETQSFVTAGDMQERLESLWNRVLDSQIILDAFQRLARSGRYKLLWESDPKLRKRFPGERIAQLLNQRRWQNRICWSITTAATLLYMLETPGQWVLRLLGFQEQSPYDKFFWGGIAIAGQILNLFLKIYSTWRESSEIS